jgi:ribose transport system substrate-binding protein
MKLLKKGLQVVATVLALAVAGGASAKPLEIAWVHSNAAAQSEQRSRAGFEKWIADEKLDWRLSTLDSNGLGENVANNLDNAVQRNVDAVILSMADLRASKAIIQKAAASGVPIFTIDSGWVPGVIQDITTNNWELSAGASLYFLDSIGDKGNIVVLTYVDHHGTRKRGDTFKTMLKEFPDVKILAEYNIANSGFFEDTTRVMEDYVARFGDKIDGVWAPWDEPAMAAAKVLSAHGLHAKVLGIDGHPNAVAEIKKPGSNFVVTAAQPFERMGQTVGEMIRKVVVDKNDPSKLFTTHTTYLAAPLVHQ